MDIWISTAMNLNEWMSFSFKKNFLQQRYEFVVAALLIEIITKIFSKNSPLKSWIICRLRWRVPKLIRLDLISWPYQPRTRRLHIISRRNHLAFTGIAFRFCTHFFPHYVAQLFWIYFLKSITYLIYLPLKTKKKRNFFFT